MESIFTQLYENRVWGDNKHAFYEGSSGGGSEEDYNADAYIPFLKEFIKTNNIRSVVDLGCGDFRCGKRIYEELDVWYSGYDTYQRVIEYHRLHYAMPKYAFIHSDFAKEKERIHQADLCILKDVLQHWSLDNIYTFLDFLMESKKFKYILICNCCNQTRHNTDIENGDMRPLSCSFFPLLRYKPTLLMHYRTKEVSVIRVP